MIVPEVTPYLPAMEILCKQYGVERMSLTRIVHKDLLQKPGSMMKTSLDFHGDLGRIAPYRPASQCSSPLSHQASQLPRHDQYEISEFIGAATNQEKFSTERSDLDCLVKFSNEHDNLVKCLLALGEALEKICHRSGEVVFASTRENSAFRKTVEKSKALIYDVLT